MGCTIRWFMDFLTEKEGTPDECKTNGREYRTFRTPDAVFLEDIRDGGHANVVGVSLKEIASLVEELQQISAEEFAKEE
jgi:hypothetical protein